MKKNINFNKFPKKVIAASLVGSSVLAGTAFSNAVVAYANDQIAEGHEQEVGFSTLTSSSQRHLIDNLPNVTVLEATEEAVTFDFTRSNATDSEHGRVLLHTIYINDVEIRNVRFHELGPITITSGEEVSLESDSLYTIRVEAVYIPFLDEEVRILGESQDVLIGEELEVMPEPEHIVEPEPEIEPELEVEPHEWLDSMPNVTVLEVTEESLVFNFTRSNAVDPQHGRVLHYTIYVNDVEIRNVRFHELGPITLTAGKEVNLEADSVYSIRVEAVYVPFLSGEVRISGETKDVLIESEEVEEIEEEEEEELEIELHEWLESMPNVTSIEVTEDSLVFDFNRATESNPEHGRVLYYIVHLNDTSVRNIRLSQTGPITLTHEDGVNLEIGNLYDIRVEAVYVPFLYQEVRIEGQSMSVTIEEEEIVQEPVQEPVIEEEEPTPPPVIVISNPEILADYDVTHNSITFRFADIQLGVNHELIDYTLYVDNEVVGTITPGTNEIKLGADGSFDFDLERGQAYELVVKANVRNTITGTTFSVESNVLAATTDALVEGLPTITRVMPGQGSTTIEFNVVNALNSDHGTISYEIIIDGTRQNATANDTSHDGIMAFFLGRNLDGEHTLQINAIYTITDTEEKVTIEGEEITYPFESRMLHEMFTFESVEDEDTKEPELVEETEEDEDKKEPEEVTEEDESETESEEVAEEGESESDSEEVTEEGESETESEEVIEEGESETESEEVTEEV